LVLGAGAREHALFWSCLQSPEVTMVYAAPGNGATAALNASVRLDPKDPAAVLRAVGELEIDLTVIGPDDVVAAGVADALEAAGKQVFGPTAAAGRVESSKAFAKELMAAAGVPTGHAEVFADAAAARDYARAQGTGLVVKADGLALGKGVLVCDDADATLAAVDRMMVERAFGEAGTRVLLEERLSGPELSLMCLCDGTIAVPLAPARDYKRAGEGDTGPNTGGMGACSPPSDAGPETVARIVRECAEPLLAELARRGTPYRGCLYVQVMLTADGPKVVEYNARFGDPEAQVVLPRLRTDLVNLMLACIRNHPGDHGRRGSREGLGAWSLDWDPRPRVGVVLASGGYPGKYETGKPIGGLVSLDPGVLPFHAGTRYESGAYYTSGGRVLTLVAPGETVAEAREVAQRNAARVSFEGSFHRRDIAALEP
jgi:phosphoribosylamine--glycine ligase